MFVCLPRVWCRCCLLPNVVIAAASVFVVAVISVFFVFEFDVAAAAVSVICVAAVVCRSLFCLCLVVARCFDCCLCLVVARCCD